MNTGDFLENVRLIWSRFFRRCRSHMHFTVGMGICGTYSLCKWLMSFFCLNECDIFVQIHNSQQKTPAWTQLTTRLVGKGTEFIFRKITASESTWARDVLQSVPCHHQCFTVLRHFHPGLYFGQQQTTTFFHPQSKSEAKQLAEVNECARRKNEEKWLLTL